jgi:large subunit ribosomal protein L3
MPIGLLGKKLGMTHIYDDYGRRRAVTVVQAGPCTVVGLREAGKHGYHAVQLAYEQILERKVNKPRMGQFKKSGVTPFRYIREFRLREGALEAAKNAIPATKAADAAEGEPKAGGNGGLQVGQQLTVELFQQHELVDVTGTSIGKGFQGGVRRWGWKGGSQTHGSMSHRAPGSIGSTTTPGRVWRGHHLPGHMGARRVTVQNVRIARLDPEHHLIMLEGSVPGAENEMVIVYKSQKRAGVIKAPQAFALVIEDDENLSKTAKAASKKPKTAAK